MKLHDLKTWHGPFDAVWHGLKRYEIRKDDRGYEVGDALRLREYDPTTRTYGSCEVIASVTYKTSGGEWGLPEGMCVLGISVLERRVAGRPVLVEAA